MQRETIQPNQERGPEEAIQPNQERGPEEAIQPNQERGPEEAIQPNQERGLNCCLVLLLGPEKMLQRALLWRVQN